MKSLIRHAVWMEEFTTVVEKCTETGLFVGYLPGFPGAHSQGETLDDLKDNLEEVLSLLGNYGALLWES